MVKVQQLSKRQLAVIDDMFDGELQKQALLEKHKLSRRLFNKWLASEAFNSRLDRRMAWERRRSEFMLARHATSAAARLVGLTVSTTPETARKAYLDIISIPALANRQKQQPTQPQTTNCPPPELPPETASRLLAALAEQEHEKTML
jgi:hypothetical protein